ncbi:hypothetical protein, partial [Nocardioides sp.]|uniref:hypothetical protein n=1 Tax=Nocardioides sp. TaxID=35761 RepID=UPI0025EA84C8
MRHERIRVETNTVRTRLRWSRHARFAHGSTDGALAHALTAAAQTLNSGIREDGSRASLVSL